MILGQFIHSGMCRKIMEKHQDNLLDLPPVDEVKPTVIQSFVDEAGDSTLFNSKGETLIGSNGCSCFFMMGKLDVEAPQELGTKLTTLRQTLLANPYFADEHWLFIAKRGAKSRNGAIVRALEQAEKEFVDRFGVTLNIRWDVTISDPVATVCLQAADYFLWALQRFYEEREKSKTMGRLREDRYLNMLWPQFATVQDLHFGDSNSGMTFTHNNPLTLETRFEASEKGKKKMS